jgi:rhodanese-related sulfurtransferase
MPINQWSPQQLQQGLQENPSILLLDVREDNEFAYARIDGSLHIPLGQIPGRLNELDAGRDIVAICHHGVRSQQACQFLQQAGFERLYNLKGGIDAWSVSCDPTVRRY